MDSNVKKYDNGEITVVWQPEKCIHSTLCWRGLIEVFNPKRRPWVDIKGAGTDKIIEQVNTCSSGALSYLANDDAASTEEKEIKTIIETMKNGPLMVYGNITIKKKDGTEEHNVTAFCRCGASSNKPFCDGSHARIGFKDE